MRFWSGQTQKKCGIQGEGNICEIFSRPVQKAPIILPIEVKAYFPPPLFDNRIAYCRGNSPVRPKGQAPECERHDTARGKSTPLAAERFITASDSAGNRMAGAAMTGSERTMILPHSVRSAGRQKMRFRVEWIPANAFVTLGSL